MESEGRAPSPLIHPAWRKFTLPSGLPIYQHRVNTACWTLREFLHPVHERRGGVLADEMGLGKTVVSIALILASKARG